ncbi:hypothetical protein, partial [Clostridium perfringens]
MKPGLLPSKDYDEWLRRYHLMLRQSWHLRRFRILGLPTPLPHPTLRNRYRKDTAMALDPETFDALID